MTLPVDIAPGDPNHAALHNDVNAAVNDINAHYPTDPASLYSHSQINGTLNTGTIAATTTSYLAVGASSAVSEANASVVMTFAGTAKRLYLRTSTTQPASGNMVVTVRKNGVATGITFTILANDVAQDYSDTTHSFTFAVGDKISFECANAASAVSAVIRQFSLGVHAPLTSVP